MAYIDYIPHTLKDFRSDPHVTCVGVEIDEDVARLRNEYGNNCSSTADIMELASRRYSFHVIFGRRPGLKDLAWLVAGLNMEKARGVCKSEWEAIALSSEQIKYACVDAYVSYRVARELLLGN